MHHVACRVKTLTAPARMTARINPPVGQAAKLAKPRQEWAEQDVPDHVACCILR